MVNVNKHTLIDVLYCVMQQPHHSPIQLIQQHIVSPSLKTLHAWKNIPSDTIIEAFNMLSPEQVSELLWDVSMAQKTHLTAHYTELNHWQEISVFRHIHDSTLPWADRELLWLSDYHIESSLRAVKSLFYASLEHHFIQTGVYHVLFFELPYSSLKNIIQKQPNILRDFGTERRYQLLKNMSQNNETLDAGRFLFEYDIDSEDAWELAFKSLYSNHFNDLFFQYKEKAPKGFWKEFLLRRSTSPEEERLLLDVLTTEELEQLIEKADFSIWGQSLKELERYVDKSVIKKHINNFCLPKDIRYPTENLAWIQQNFRGNSTLIKDLKKAVGYRSVAEVAEALRAQKISFVNYANILMYHMLIVHADLDYQHLVESLYNLPFDVYYTAIHDSFDDQDMDSLLSISAMACPLPHCLNETALMVEIPLFE